MAHLAELIAKLGDEDALGLLIPGSSENDLNQALSAAARAGNINAVNQLIPVSNPRRPGTDALILAVKNHHHQVVSALASKCDARADHSLALCIAATNGDLTMVKAPKGFSNVNADKDRALRMAAANGHDKIIQELIGDQANTVFRQQVRLTYDSISVGALELINELVPYVDRLVLQEVERRLSSPIFRGRIPAFDTWLHKKLARRHRHHLMKILVRIAPSVKANPPRRRL